MKTTNPTNTLYVAHNQEELHFGQQAPVNDVLLNVGLWASGSKKEQKNVVSKTLAAIAFHFKPFWFRAEIATANETGEPTLVIHLRTINLSVDARFAANVDVLCNVLLQDCIAFTVDGEGYLLGPKAGDWGGKFNAYYFILPSWSAE